MGVVEPARLSIGNATSSSFENMVPDPTTPPILLGFAAGSDPQFLGYKAWRTAEKAYREKLSKEVAKLSAKRGRRVVGKIVKRVPVVGIVFIYKDIQIRVL